MRPRWDIDERGQGVGDARRLLPGARATDDRIELGIVTGVVSDEGRFPTNGHTLLLRVTP